MIQGSEEWIVARLGRLTGSRIHDATARTRTGWGASRDNYMAELIAERLTGVPAEQYVNAAMEHGTRTEPEARSVYCFMQDVEVVEVGFVEHPAIAMAGASPDGLVGDDGMVELKCPNTATHIATLLGGSIPDKYIKQVQWQMACTKRQWCDWVSYDPRMPDDMRMFMTRVLRNDELIAELEQQAIGFLAELDQKVGALIGRYRAAA